MQVDLSVIIEWENVLLAEEERCVQMLGRLRSQALASGRRLEVLVLFNPEQVARAVVESAVARYLLPAAEDGRQLACRIEPGPGLHYYQLKNLGVGLARGEVIAFVDSDVIPEDGWLDALTEPFWGQTDIQVLAGHTYLDHGDLLGRAFALGWFFPLRRPDSGLTRDARHFYANNVAFRRPVLAAHPFPEMTDGMTRGACLQLTDALRREGIPIWRQDAARCSHPAPNGLGHFMARGLAMGRDWAMARQEQGIPGWRSGLLAVRKVVSNTWRMLKRTLRHGRAVGLPGWQAPLAIGIMSVFYLEYCLGTWAYLLAPATARRWWRI